MSAQTKPSVLVTGGAGFVGSHIANRLAGRFLVVAFDNLSHGSLANLIDHEDVSIQVGDVRSGSDLATIFEARRIDFVVHCAAQTSVPLSMAEPDVDWEINVAGTRNLLRVASHHSVKRFVFLSSGGAVYGETDEPAREKSLPGPRSYYGLHKFAAEQLVRTEGLPYAILRPSNIFGPRQRSDADGGAIAIFLERFLTGQAVDVFGDGTQERDFVFVDDVVEAVEAAMSAGADVLWNVSSGVSTSVNDLVARLALLLREEVCVRRTQARAGDVRASVLARDELSRFLPVATNLEDGLRLTIASIRETKPNEDLVTTQSGLRLA